MATVDKLGGNWVIVRDDGMNAPDELGGSLGSQDLASSSNREFWAGDSWVGQFGFAMQFVTKEEAEAYLAEHRREMA